MSETMHLDPGERRVLGVLIEKGLTTPQYYPMTVNAIVAAANQKNNRDPISEMIDDEVSEILERLKVRGLATVVFPAGGRTEKWRQELSARLQLSGEEMAVIGELLLRGAQTVGELRARAGRMKPLETQEVLQAVLDRLMARPQPLVIRLTDEGQKRGVRVTHGLYPEAEQVAQKKGIGPAPVPSVRASVAAADSVELRGEVAELRRRVEAIELRLGLSDSTLSGA